MPTWNADQDRRLLLALLAANSTLRINNKQVSELYGYATANGVEHRFRVLKKEAKDLVTAFEQGTGPTSTPRKRGASSTPKPTPRKKQRQSVMANAAAAASPVKQGPEPGPRLGLGLKRQKSVGVNGEEEGEEQEEQEEEEEEEEEEQDLLGLDRAGFRGFGHSRPRNWRPDSSLFM
ncbi:hypothetical protein FN846DRAFT_1025436 [Sphaerosporella brunnea]|uniref:Uncharacterized protein n=1 Tax=Sphaerosporella brunnea TaxID=1250544 RepID=A0A5J5EFN4_9PEZI|nr:hypothetical protein FN846DRAFT_1025436 [Sphaerosporella brunnea]